MTSFMKCPQCGSTEDFSTIEQAIMYSEVEYVDNNGLIEWTGTTEGGDESLTVGIWCRNCDWASRENKDYEWMDELA